MDFSSLEFFHCNSTVLQSKKVFKQISMLKNLLKFYAQEAGSAWIRIVLFCVISGLSSGLVLTTINTAIQARFENALSSDHIFQFALLLSVFLLSTHFAMKLGIILSSEMMHELRTNLANRIANTDFAVIENYDKGEIFAHFAVDINQLVRTALSLINALQASVVLIFCLGLTHFMNTTSETPCKYCASNEV